MRVAPVALVLIAWAAGSPASGEIEKRATVCEQRLCFHWWPKLPALEGWHQDEAQSFEFGIHA